MKRYLPVLALAGLALAPAAPARAHEPLWGESPTVFGFGIFHPEVRFGFRDAGSIAHGGIRQRSLDEETEIAYAPSTAINLRLSIPWMESIREQRIGGHRRQVVLNGLGDLAFDAKRRFHVEQGEGLNVQHSLLYGIKLPTGESNLSDVGGRRADPHDQPGTGKLGLRVGYAWDRETLDDTLWGSFRYGRDLGGGFRMGDMLEADFSYGRWLIHANEASQTGLNLALGLHGEFHNDDHQTGGRAVHNGHRLLGVHLTPIVTKGLSQFRLGLFVPFVRSGPGDHTGFPYEVRAAIERHF